MTRRPRRSVQILGLAPVCGLSCVLILVVVFMRSGGPDRRSGGRDQDGASQSESRALEPRDSTGDERREPVRAEALESTTASGASELASIEQGAEAAASPVPDVPLSGRLVMLDEQGRELGGMNGSMTLQYRLDGYWFGEPFDVRVEEGRFRFDPPERKAGGDHHLELTVAGLLVEHRAGYGTLERFPVQPPDGVVIQGRWYRETTVRVFDARTRAELHEVELLRRFGLTEDHPGVVPFDESVAERTRAPLTFQAPPDLGAFDGVEELWLRSAESRWQRLFVDHRSGGEGRVLLEPGADLAIELTGEIPPRYRVEVSALEDASSDAGSPRDRILAVAEGQEDPDLRLCGLPLGPVGVRVEGESSVDGPAQLVGHATAELVAGRVTSLTVVMEHADRSGVPLSGTIALDPSLIAHARARAEPVSVLLELTIRSDDSSSSRLFRHLPCEEFSPVPGRPGLWSWDAGLVPSGSYCLDHRLGVEREVDLGPEGRRDVHVVIPDLAADVEVRFVDERTGEELRGGLLSWRRDLSEDARVSGVGLWDSERGAFRLFAEPGTLQLDLGHATHELAEGSRSLLVPPGTSRHTIGARPGCALVLRARLDGLPVPAPVALSRAEVQAEDGAGGVVRVDHRDLRVIYFVSAPGTYELRFPDIDGFRTPEALRVDVVEGFSERLIELVRDR